MLRAVFDANIFVSALIRPAGPPGQLIVKLVSDGAFELIATPAIEQEVLAALAYPRVKKAIKKKVDARAWVEDVLFFADIVEDIEIEPVVSEDPDDDKYIAAALAGRARFIVTGDKHLLDLGEVGGVRIAKPKDFLALLD